MALRLRRPPDLSLDRALAGLALSRAAARLGMLLRPALLPAGLGTPRAASAGAGWVVQMLGAREVGLGLGAYAAGRRRDRRAERLWLLAGLVTDALDAVAVGRATGAGDVARAQGVAGVGVAATATALQAAGLARRR